MKKRVVSYSELDTYRQCPHKWELAYKERWVPEKSDALALGIAWHHLMAEHYDPNLTPKAWDWVTPDGDLFEWMYDGYREYYGDDPDWTIMAIELKFEIPFKPRSPYWLKGAIDLIVADHDKGGLWVVDHKSGANLPRHKNLQFETQFALYVWAQRQLGVDIRGTIYNAVRTKKLVRDMEMDERFDRTYWTWTDQQLDTIAAEAYETARQAWTSETQPRSPDPDRCNWRCGFREPCTIGLSEGPKVERLVLSETMTQDFTRH